MDVWYLAYNYLVDPPQLSGLFLLWNVRWHALFFLWSPKRYFLSVTSEFRIFKIASLESYAKTKLAKRHINVGHCYRLKRKKIYHFLTGSLLHDVIKRWRHISPCILRHSNIIAKLGNVCFVLWFKFYITLSYSSSFRTFWSTHVFLTNDFRTEWRHQ